VLQYPPETRLTVETVETVELDAATAALLDRPDGEAWTRIGGVRRLEGTGLPVAWADLFVRPEYAEVAGLIGTAEEPVYRLIARRFGETIEAVDARLSACSIPAALAAPLGVAPHGPGLLIVRRYTGTGGRVFEVSASYHPADRFSYAIRFGKP
jgi:DNA-binding GntR family transcriptional regulator